MPVELDVGAFEQVEAGLVEAALCVGLVSGGSGGWGPQLRDGGV